MKNFTLIFLTTVILITVFSSAADAQTNVSGGIYSNTTWTLVNSPYIVVDTVVVFPGVTLTIEPGVVVKFDSAIDLEIRQSTLIAIGNSTDSITFTSNSVSPIKGIYPGIYLNGGGYTSTFKYCNIRFASIGIRANVADSTTVSNSYFEQNVIGMQSVGIGNSSSQVAKIDSSIFNNNTIGLVVADLLHATISYCNFSHDSINGFILGDQNSYTFTATVNNCNFLNNGIGLSMNMYYATINHCNFSNNNIGLKGPGFQTCCGTWNNIIKNSIFNFNQTGMNNQGHTLIDSCTISHNQTGYLVGGKNSILNTTVDSNNVIGLAEGGDSIVNCNVRYNGIGIQTLNGSQIYGCSVEYNTFKNIEGYGRMSGNTIQYSNFGIDDSTGGNGWLILSENVIENNNVGIRLNTSNNTITCNSICNNTTYDLQYGAINNIIVSNNNWCMSDSALLENLIFDGYDNVSYGLVSFMPMDTLGCSPTIDVPFTEKENALFSIYPNPTLTSFTIKNISDHSLLQILNPLGKIVYSEKLTGKDEQVIDAHLPAGFYFVQVSTEKEMMTGKLVVE